MNLPSWAGSRWPSALLVLVPLLYAGLLVEREWRFRQDLGRAVPALAPPPAAARDLPNVQAVATVLGLAPEGAHAPSTEPLTLQASFVVDQGLSRALLADATGPRIYQVGERLPGGSVLRRVEPGHVMLWRNGREERLALQPTAQPLLRPVNAGHARQAKQFSSQYLRPVTGQTE
ncbi:type II secretion system protein N [Pseudomonas citrulli]|uniref:Type II secretion system protein N n=1 Tax=Pseudomonas citrulli TaxID=3064347 RepID=A0ABT9BZB6_9PSED|nr:type II secretion system protein N [Pseudomonas sp. K18]MDO7897878.1 type II secretion system protein N [Pseudomonas sp. K18]